MDTYRRIMRNDGEMAESGQKSQRAFDATPRNLDIVNISKSLAMAEAN